ncbi:DUF1176 domain-containing protein [Klebsiella aerogenes]|uniref:DUF1176 domain-containing protein n=1 Tax=Klebsiella aerogenes TaxID=548 RepID=UPI0021D1160C|nr:DUF1176 domain-containing protein [Klebsiella aerogenes]MCU6319177.1 DUF1176 domain-containing protein [Klebsiella aerogenes]
MRPLLWAAVLGLCSTSLMAAPPRGCSFAYKDWEVACDNTGTCRAAGYGATMGEVSVLLTRSAGPGRQATAQVTFAQTEHDIPPDASVNLFINDNDRGALETIDDSHFHFDSTQTSALITALEQNAKIELALNAKQQQKWLSQLESTLNSQCDDWQNAEIPANERQITVAPLDKNHSLLQTLCWRAAYNDGYAIWVVDNTQAARPQLITTDASSYNDGVMTFFNKGRGVADCVKGEERVWDGKTFVQSLKYSTGMCREITPGGTWQLPTFVSKVIPRQQREADILALKTLQDAVLKEQKRNPELALENIAEQFPLSGHISHFTLTYADDAPVSTTKPAADISDDEWQAFLHSDISADSENGKVSFTLIDLDGDGKRDLIIDSYVGGTGLFSYTGVLKRGDNTFESVNNADSNDDDNFDAGVPGALYSINDRGANQWSRWIRINGQVYALWFNGVFGEDNLYLLRPFNQSDLTPAITIRYRYNLNIISAAENEQTPTPALNDIDRAGLLKSLDVMQGSLLKDKSADDSDEPICPIPPGTAKDDADSYYGGAAGHYTVETVAWIPVWLNDKCFIGTIFSHHGAYRHGVDAILTISSPRDDEELVGDYDISGKRHAIAITSGWKVREGDNGVM